MQNDHIYVMYCDNIVDIGLIRRKLKHFLLPLVVLDLGLF